MLHGLLDRTFGAGPKWTFSAHICICSLWLFSLFVDKQIRRGYFEVAWNLSFSLRQIYRPRAHTIERHKLPICYCCFGMFFSIVFSFFNSVNKPRTEPHLHPAFTHAQTKELKCETMEYFLPSEIYFLCRNSQLLIFWFLLQFLFRTCEFGQFCFCIQSVVVQRRAISKIGKRRRQIEIRCVPFNQTACF